MSCIQRTIWSTAARACRALESLRAHSDISLHGVGMNLGGLEELDRTHLNAFKRLIDRFDPILVSEHLAWSSHRGSYLADLLPVPLSDVHLQHLCRVVDEAQSVLGRELLIENPSWYFALPQSVIPENDFFAELCARTGCKRLVDVNNAYVSAHNLKRDAHDYLAAIDAKLIGQIHLAGHAIDANAGDPLLIDDHGCEVCNEVWALYGALVARVGERPTLVEWDTDVPSWSVLAGQAERAAALVEECNIPSVASGLGEAVS